ncbi:MAG: carbohydrate ABC transporter permease [Desulfurococcales archaeon]|nr:carbohydrate ABC transporter permease [Desulfurococcales archaeon]
MARVRPAVLLSTVIAWGLAVVWALPFIGLVMVSLRPYSEVLIKGWWSIGGAHFTLENFKDAWSNPMYSVERGYINSLIVTIPSTIAPILIAALAAYAFSRFSFPLKNYLFITLLVIMSMPQQMSVIPLFFMLKELHLLDRLAGLILVHSSWGLAWITFFLKNFFDSLPREMEEAARVDGAGELQIFLRIVLPASLPALASVAAIQFTWVWSDFFYALMFLISPENYVVTLQVGTMKGQYHLDWGLLSAGSIFAMLVPLLLYAGLQKYYVRGMIGWTAKG